MENRELKFRVWIPDYEEMIVLENTGVQKFDCENGFSAMFTADRYTEIWAHENYGVKNDLMLMQFTGLKDANGKDIYEGDIVQSKSGDIMRVSWNEKFASFCLDKKGWLFSHYFGEAVDPNDCEIIGNIHQHPHLIK